LFEVKESTETENTYIDVVYQPTLTTVQIGLKGTDFNSTGKAKLNPGDFYDKEVGFHLALGRALEKFGRKMANLASANSETMHQHDQRIKQERQIERLLETLTEPRQERHELTETNPE
jgi:hypothetical protein